MAERKTSRAFTLIELLVVMSIIMVLAGLLLGGISAAKKYVARARTQNEISNMMIALTQYNADFSAYPPGGTDSQDDGNLDNNGSDDLGAGKLPADPNHPSALELQLRTITVQFKIEGGNRTIGPWYQPNRSNIVSPQGAMVDIWGNPFRYLADGRRATVNPATGMRMLGRVNSRMPVIWSVGQDGKQDPLNDNIDNNNDGKVDDPNELVDDICSWNSN